MMIRIMFVCHGNICRSPMAEFILKDLIKKYGLDGEFFVSSSATSTEEIQYIGGVPVGNPVYPPAVKELAKHGISCGGKRAVQLKHSDRERYDVFVCMDSANVRNASRILGGSEKIRKLMSYVGSDKDVSDPWYTDRFDIAYRDIYEGCVGILKYYKNNTKE